jgi:hypothetical protein
MERDTVFSTVAYGANWSATGVSWKPDWAKDILVGTEVGSEWIDSEGRPWLADFSIGEVGGGEIQ